MMCAQQKLMALFKHQLNTSQEHVHYDYLGEFYILCCTVLATGIGQMDKKNVDLEPNCSTTNCNYFHPQAEKAKCSPLTCLQTK